MTTYGLSDEIYTGVFPHAGHLLTWRMIEAQGGVGFMDWFRQPQPAYANQTPEQLVRAGRTSAIIQICEDIKKARRESREH